jgi:hypothetical protein
MSIRYWKKLGEENAEDFEQPKGQITNENQNNSNLL